MLQYSNFYFPISLGHAKGLDPNYDVKCLIKTISSYGPLPQFFYITTKMLIFHCYFWENLYSFTTTKSYIYNAK